MKRQLRRTLMLLCLLACAVGASAQSNRIRMTHQLTRWEGSSERMGNGEADDKGWKLTFSFQNAPAASKNYLRIRIWREKDIFHPKNTTNTGVNWSALEVMSFNVDPDHAVNPRRYGYVIGDPKREGNEDYDSQLLFEWTGNKPYTVSLPDYLFMNMPLPPRPDDVWTVPVKYYIAYELCVNDVNFSSERGITPSVTYTMYVPEQVANIGEETHEDLSSLFEDDEPQCPPHKWERFKKVERAGFKTKNASGNIFSEESLVMDITETVPLSLLRQEQGKDAWYASADVYWRQLWEEGTTFRETEAFLELLSDTSKVLNEKQMALSLPTPEQMKTLLPKVADGSLGQLAQRLKGFYVDEVQVSLEDGKPLSDEELENLPADAELTVSVGVMTPDGELVMVDPDTHLPAVGFFAVGEPWAIPYQDTYNRYRKVSYRQCSICGEIRKQSPFYYLGARRSRVALPVPEKLSKLEQIENR